MGNSEAAKNAKLLREFQLIPRLLLTLRDTSLSQPTVAAICNVLSLLLQGFPNQYDLLRYGPALAPPAGVGACPSCMMSEIKRLFLFHLTGSASSSPPRCPRLPCVRSLLSWKSTTRRNSTEVT